MVHCCFTNLLIALIFCKPCCALVRNTKHKSFFSFLFPSYSRPANANNLCTFFVLPRTYASVSTWLSLQCFYIQLRRHEQTRGGRDPVAGADSSSRHSGTGQDSGFGSDSARIRIVQIEQQSGASHHCIARPSHKSTITKNLSFIPFDIFLTASRLSVMTYACSSPPKAIPSLSDTPGTPEKMQPADKVNNKSLSHGSSCTHQFLDLFVIHVSRIIIENMYNSMQYYYVIIRVIMFEFYSRLILYSCLIENRICNYFVCLIKVVSYSLNDNNSISYTQFNIVQHGPSVLIYPHNNINILCVYLC